MVGEQVTWIRNLMKSVITQGATVAKAIEEALKKADMPKEFFVKVLEDAQAGFLGFGAKKAKIALFFKEDSVSTKHHQESMFERGSYENLFNNPSIKKQIEQQLKDLGLEIKPMIAPKKSTAAQHEPAPVSSASSTSTTKMHTRPLPNKSQQSTQPRRQSAEQPSNGSAERKNVTELPGQSGQPDEFRRKRRSRYYRPRSRSNSNGSPVNPSDKPSSDGSDF